MRSRREPCDDRRLRALLAADEDSAEYRAAAEHLESCATCRDRLSDLAGHPNDWEEARAMLTRDEVDAALQQEQADRSWNRARSGEKDNAWTDAMAGQLLSPPSHPEMLGRLGRYEIERWLGSGGMGVVFKGFDTELNRPVAIKVLALHLAGNGPARQRFAREARAAAAVVHEHVVAIHDVESDAATPYLVMQYVAGESLQSRLDRQGPLDLCEILRIAHQTASGLAAAHAQGLVHRDVKPSNILLEQGVERALLTDFGLARASDDASLTHTGYLPGTPHYMSPEQARGESVDALSDLFSLGSVIYAMCTGRPPFRADTGFGILRRITDTKPRAVREVNPAVPVWLEALVARLHAKRPADRFQSAGQVATLLERCLAHVQQPNVVPLPEACRPSPRWRRRAARNLTAMIGAVVFVTALAAYVVWNARPQANPPESSTRSARQQSSVAVQPSRPSTQPQSAFDSDWDAVERQLQRLSTDAAVLESQVLEAWPQPGSFPVTEDPPSVTDSHSETPP